MKKQSGSGLIFAVVLLFVILGMVITLSSVTVLETKMNQKTKSSVGAFYNSESGVEYALNQIASLSGSVSSFPGWDASGHFANCPPTFGTNVCKIYFLDKDNNVMTGGNISDIQSVRSVGTQGGETQRAIEAAVAATDDIYQTTCSTNATISFSMCCRIERKTGIVGCKATSGTTGSWLDYTNMYPAWTSASSGSYQISCSATNSQPVCCRTNALTGNVECAQAAGFAGPWVKWSSAGLW